jgi:hypothetical protein
MTSTRDEDLAQEPQSERGEPGSRDTGSDKPSAGPAERPSGSIDDEAVPTYSDPNTSDR